MKEPESQAQESQGQGPALLGAPTMQRRLFGAPRTEPLSRPMPSKSVTPLALTMDPALAERLRSAREAMKWQRLVRAAEAAAKAVVEAVRERRRRRWRR